MPVIVSGSNGKMTYGSGSISVSDGTKSWVEVTGSLIASGSLFRVETQNMTHAIFADGINDKVSIGASVDEPAGVLEISQGASHGDPALVISAADVDEIAVDIDASQTTANVIDVAATALTTGKALFIDAGNATTTSTTAGPIVHVDFDKTGIVASGQTSTFIGLDLDMNDAATNVGTSTMTGMDLDVVSSNAGGTVSNIGLDVNVAGADTNNGLEITTTNGAGSDIKIMSSVDSGDYFSIATTTHGATTLATVDDDSNDDADLTLDADGKIVIEAKAGDEVVFNEAGLDVDFRVESADESHLIFVEGSTNRVSIGDNTGSPGATLEVKNHASAGAFDVPLVRLNSNDPDQIALDINGNANDTASVVDILANAATSGHALTIATAALTTGNALHINHDDTATTAVTPATVHVDFDKTGVTADTETSTYTGLDLDMSDGATNHAGSTVTMTGLDIDVDSTNDTGTNTNIGVDIVVTDATTNDGIRVVAEDAAGADIKMISSADPADYCTIAVAGSGATTLTTVDGGAAAANLTFTVDGAITQTAAGLIKLDGSGVEIENASSSGTHALLIDNDDVDEMALHIDAANTTEDVVGIEADAVTTASVIDVTADALTYGKILNLVSDSSNATSPNTLVSIDNDNTAAVATIALHVKNDAIAASGSVIIETTAAETNPLLELRNSNAATDKPAILSLNRSNTSAEADDMSLGTIRFDGVDAGDAVTSYVSIDAIASDIVAGDEGGKLTFNVFAGGTAGTAASANLFSIGGEDAAAAVCEVAVNDAGIDCDFRVESDQMTHALFIDSAASTVQIGASTSTPGGVLEVNQYAGGHGSGVPAFKVVAAHPTQIAVDIDASQTTANVVDIAASALTTGNALHIDHNDTATGEVGPTTIHVDFDKTGITGDGVSAAWVGLDLDMNDGATNHAGATVTMTGLDLDMASSNAQGTLSNIGLDVNVAGADTNYAALFRSGSVGIGGAIAASGPKVALDVHYDPTGLGNDTGGGEVVYFGTGPTKKGALYYLNTSGVWISASAVTTGSGHNQLLGIALGVGNPSDNGMLIRGFYNVDTYLSAAFVKGAPVYVCSGTVAAESVAFMSQTAPSPSSRAPGTGNSYVRVVGYGTNTTDVIYFNPSGTYVETQGEG